MMSRLISSRRVLFLSVILLIPIGISASRWVSQRFPAGPPLEGEIAASVQPSSPTPSETPTLVSTPTLTQTSTEEPTADPSPTSSPSPTPIRFVFPGQGAAPISAWRPPLYPIPWAPTAHDHFYFARPIGANEVNWPEPFYRYGGVFFANTVHTGVDIAAPEGTPVLATGPGKVTWAGYGFFSGGNNPDDPYGLAVAIRHDFGYQGSLLYTVYGHMSRVDVTRGQYVETGDQLGLVGETGFTTGPHLHFEVRLRDGDLYTTVNPELWMAPPQGWGVLAGRVMGTSGQMLHTQDVQIKSLETEQAWRVISYGPFAGVHSDPFYNENLVMGDLPAGRYELIILFAGRKYIAEISIEAGQVNYFTFRGRHGITPGLPPTPEAEFTPAAPATP